MISFLSNRSFQKLSFNYFLYCFLFILIHLMLVSVLSFFHFLLDHEMGIVENWLSLNGWEILVLGKVLAFAVMAKFLVVNTNEKNIFFQHISHMERLPSKRVVAIIIFLLIMFYSLLNQFGGGIQSNQILDQLFLSSYLGSIFFYGIDILFLIFLGRIFQIKLKYSLPTFLTCLILFFISSKIVLPYTGKYAVFLIVHFSLLFYLSSHQNIGNIISYLALVVAPLSSFLGVDLVWDNSYSVFTYSKQLPVLGVLLIWGVALGYYQRSYQD